jgi:hypothetical protein
MGKIFRQLNKYARAGINMLARIILALAYLVFLFPFAVIVRLRTDYLETKNKTPRWLPLGKPENPKELLRHQ